MRGTGRCTGAACGLRPYLPTLLAGALASAGALGIGFTNGRFDFLQSAWWLLAVAAVLVAGYALQLRLGVERFEAVAAPAITGQAIAAGALLFAGTLAAHHDAWWPGLLFQFRSISVTAKANTAAAIARRASGTIDRRRNGITGPIAFAVIADSLFCGLPLIPRD